MAKATEYRGAKIRKVVGKREVWFAINLGGREVGTAATEYAAMQQVDRILA